jgi:hypothetical protein
MTTAWEYLIVNQREHVDSWGPQVIPFETWELDCLGRHGWELVCALGPDRLVFKRPKPDNVSTSLTETIEGETRVASFSVNATDGLVDFQFTNAEGGAVAGPDDSVTGSPIAPEATVDNTSVLTVAPSVAGANPGAWTAALTPVAAGTANVSPVPLVNSDGSAVDEANGQPFAEPTPVQVTVTPDDTPTGFSMAVTG